MIYIGVAVIAVLVGMAVGALLQFLAGEPKCRHDYEEVGRHSYMGCTKVGFICKKCGKRKIVKY